MLMLSLGFAAASTGAPWSELNDLLWLSLGITVAAPVVRFGIDVYRLREAPVGIPLAMLGVFMFVCMEPFLCYLAGTEIPWVIRRPRPEDMSMTGLAVTLFLAGLLVAWFLPWFRDWGTPLITRLEGPRSGREAVVLAGGLLLVGIIPFVIFGTGGGLIDRIVQVVVRARSGGYLQFETQGAGAEHPLVLLMGNGVLASAAVASYALIAFRVSPNTRLVLLGLFVLGSVLAASAGGRTRAGFVLISMLLFYLLACLRERRTRILVLMPALSLGVLLLMAFQVTYRARGWDRVEGEVSGLVRDVGFELNRELTAIVCTYDEHSFLGGETLLERAVLPIPELLVSFAVSPIPRRAWPDKPLDPSIPHYNELRTGVSGLGQEINLTATVMGRAYIKYGLLGVFQIGLLVGLCWRWVSWFIARHRPLDFPLLVACTLAFYLLQATRELSPGWLYTALFPAAGCVAFDLAKRLLPRSRRVPRWTTMR